MKKRLLFLIVMFFSLTSAVMAQITTSGISGKVTSKGEEVIGATITATHQPSGTIYRGLTNLDGRFTIQGMRVGGPYKVEIAYLGQQTKTFEGVTLRLGEVEDLSCKLESDAKELQEIVVVGKAGLNGTKTGAAQSLTSRQIADMPSITHGIADVARLNPQLTTSSNGAMSFAGTNNRYNSFMIDGAMNNDVFGLTADGSNGGQAGAQPVSMETIEQIQINVAPFDVRQSQVLINSMVAYMVSVIIKTLLDIIIHTLTEQDMLLNIRNNKNINGDLPWVVLLLRINCSSSSTLKMPIRNIQISMAMVKQVQEY